MGGGAQCATMAGVTMTQKLSAGNLVFQVQVSTIHSFTGEFYNTTLSCILQPYAGSHAVHGRTFSSNPSLPIVMDAVTCNGEEASLGDCIYRGSEDLRSCTHAEDAGVRCPLGTA